MPKLGKFLVHPPARAALIAQRPMLGNTMPRIVRESFGEFHLRRGIERLPGQAQRGHGDARRKPLGPEHGVVLDRHQMRIGLPLQANVELDIPLRSSAATIALRR